MVLQLLDGTCGLTNNECSQSQAMIENIIARTYTQQYTRYAIGVYLGNNNMQEILSIDDSLNYDTRDVFMAYIANIFTNNQWCRNPFTNANCDNGISWMQQQLALSYNDNLFQNKKLIQFSDCNCNDNCENWSLIHENTAIDRYIVTGLYTNSPCNTGFAPSVICQTQAMGGYDGCVSPVVDQICAFQLNFLFFLLFFWTFCGFFFCQRFGLYVILPAVKQSNKCDF